MPFFVPLYLVTDEIVSIIKKKREPEREIQIHAQCMKWVWLQDSRFRKFRCQKCNRREGLVY